VSESLAWAAAAAPPGYVNLVGPRRQYYLDQDAEVKRCLPLRAKGTPEYERTLEAFKRSPLTGCATVLDLLRKESRYRPVAPEGHAATRFFILLMQQPLFRVRPTEPMSFDCTVGTRVDCNAAEIVKKYKGTDAEAARRIDEQLRVLQDAAIRNPGASQSSELLMEHSLGAGDAITFYMGRSAAQAVYVMLPPANYLYRVQGQKAEMIWEFDTAAWPNHAEAVLREHLKLVPDWIEENSR
jgi:hypothetical protein